jgi:hypothetical protein
MQPSGETTGHPKPLRNWVWYSLVVLSAEKIIQHTIVTIAFILDIRGIRSTVAVPADLLLISGAVVTILFIICLWGLFSQRKWGINLLVSLALFDIFGEFIAQGRMDIVIPLSFLVAILLIIFSLVYRRQILKI